jgi:hypothetical protein
MRSLINGFTTVRDLWCADPRYTTVDLRDAVAAGIIEGPRMLVAPHIVSACGGHGDLLAVKGPVKAACGRSSPMAVNDCDGDPDKTAGWPRDSRWPKPQRRVADPCWPGPLCRGMAAVLAASADDNCALGPRT